MSCLFSFSLSEFKDSSTRHPQVGGNVLNRPRSIYQYSNMAPRLSGQNCKFFKFLLSLKEVCPESLGAILEY